MLKKVLILPVFLVLAVFFLAADAPNRRIFIEGTARSIEHIEYFSRNFNAEALGTGYHVADNRSDAGYVFRFNVIPNTDNLNDHNDNHYYDDNRYVIQISLIDNTSNYEILTFDFFFSTLDEMYQYNQFLFLRAVSFIPPFTETEVIKIETIVETVIDDSWRNKWLYFRLSMDYPVTFYALQPTGLVGGEGGEIGVYAGSFNNPTRVSPEDNKILALPGWTLGLEAQFFNNFALELNFQFSMGDTRTAGFLNIAAAAELKFPIKFFNNFMIEPYATFAYPLRVSEIFSKFPPFTVGGGIQVGTKADSRGAFFIDIKYLFSFSEAAMRNPYGELFPNPPEIHYRRSVLGFAVGYKIGLISRSPAPSHRVVSVAPVVPVVPVVPVIVNVPVPEPVVIPEPEPEPVMIPEPRIETEQHGSIQIFYF